ncbi:PQQ-dependent sugar dehydrogenase [Spirosoma aerolatum]|uniref:PQQ-dependent sugar dehydrogenase n=1 Tax=Spirosoma aerolatum TaxID=1211326 RepID=UPI0009AE1BF6|nr:PQQ-dependent sugar dehydrogenase [Spirosoma aerolatum]
MITFYGSTGHFAELNRSILQKSTLITLVGTLMVVLMSRVQAQTFPASFSQVQVTNGLTSPTAMAFAPDGRIFVTEQGGALRVIKNGSLLPTPFIQLTVDDSGERGLIGIALDPGFTTNHYLYLYHTVPGSSAHNRISRYTANGDVVLTGSEVVILDLTSLSSATNHNGGAMCFGPDGKLYVGVGENANGANAQNLDNYLGKILRINADGSAPADNPFPTGSEPRKRIWGYGLRNPYTIAVQPGTGRIFVNDVGQSTWEEINEATTAGLNFGWPNAEGNSSNQAYTNPVFAYPHSGNGSGCAITGGAFFNPASTTYPPALVGRYFYQDLCSNWIYSLDLSTTPATSSSFATGLPGSSLNISMGLDGKLYYLSRDAGALYKFMYQAPDLSPTIVLPQSNFNPNDSRNFAVTIFEAEGYATPPGSVTVTVSAPTGYSLSFNQSLTTIDVSGSGMTSVNNGQWSISRNVSNQQLSLTMNSGQSIGAGETSILGVTITRTSANAGSTANVTINVTNDSSRTYDTNPTNNVYARIINGL